MMPLRRSHIFQQLHCGGLTMATATASTMRGESTAKQIERSPTRVADYEDKPDEKELPDNPFMLDSQPSRCRVGSRSFRRVSGKPYTSVKTVFLPTLVETASVSSSETEATPRSCNLADVDDEYPDEIELAHSAEDARVKDHGKHPTAKSTKDDFKKLKSMASNLASRGKEAEALKAYNRALRLMRTDLSRIKQSMKNVLETTLVPLQSQLFQAWVQVASEIAEIRQNMAILSERLGDYDKAIASCEEARIVHQSYANLKTKENDAEDVEIDKVEQMEHMLERLTMAKASYSDRKKLHQDAVQLQHRLASVVDPNVKEILYEDLFTVLHTALQLEQESLGETHPQVADTIAMIARVHAGRSESEEALGMMHSSVHIMRMALGPYHPRTAAALRELGGLFEVRDEDPADVDRAIRLYEEAIDIFRLSYGDHHAIVGSLLNNIAVIHIHREEFDDAVKNLSDALTVYESGVEHGDAINAQVSQVWKNLGECYSLRKEWESALFAYTSALGIQKDARRCHDVLGSRVTDSSINFSLLLEGADDSSMADTLLRLAKATAALGQYNEAVVTYEEALHIYRLMLHEATLEGNGRVTKDMVGAQERVAHTLYCIAEVEEKNFQYDEAVALYTEAFDMRLRSDAGREDNRANLVHCAMCLAGIGSVAMRQYEYTDACLVLKESLQFLEAHGVPKDHEIFHVISGRLAVAERGFLASSSFADDATLASEHPLMKVDRTLSMDKEAQIQTENGDYDAAVGTLTKALAIRRKRLTKRLKKNGCEPNLKEKNDVAKTIGNFAAVLYMKGELKQSEALFTEAIRVYRSNGMGDENPCVKDLLYGLERLHK